MSRVFVCRDCGRDFNPDGYNNKPGFINQCGDCANDVPKYVGRMGGDKSNNEITVFRSNLTNIKAVLKREASAGFNANLSIGSPASPYHSDKEDRDDLDDANTKDIPKSKLLEV